MDPQPVYVWVWLPGAADPVVAGRLDAAGPTVTFAYGRSYLEREGSIPLYTPELPLVPGQQWPRVGDIAGCIADAGPDAWGRRVIESRRAGHGGAQTADFGILTYLIESGSDRIGALDFQASPSTYVPRESSGATLAELIESAERVESGVPLSDELDRALLHGSSVGGARPKALLADGRRRVVAKFSSTTDTYAIVKAEFVAMELARRVGLDVAAVELRRALGKDVLIVDRFDRTKSGGRRLIVSALTILGLDEMTGRYASYADLADVIRARFTNAASTVHELFARIVFNILCGNNDDHARNHAAFWDGVALTLTPAYDICPQPRAGQEAAQLMAIGRDGYRMSQLVGCIDRAETYLLTRHAARAIIDNQIDVIGNSWDEVCDLGKLSEVDKARLWRRQFLNPYAMYDY